MKNKRRAKHQMAYPVESIESYRSGCSGTFTHQDFAGHKGTINTGDVQDKRTSVEVGKGGVNEHAGKGHHSGSGTNVNIGHKGVGVHT
ncbi:hypothetical protein T459_04426 [Capsicum annuum]|uniref:Uncharacterized protein n=1 Tax=Capsicum annuum TaxID=4072 RepID=A0A2G3A538_CAPAN|nr:hypothetical protein T459_04426 [Capsicum annuum]